MKTTATLSTMIGRHAYLAMGEISVEVVIIDVKERWGHTRYLVNPVAGRGQKWVEILSLL